MQKGGDVTTSSTTGALPDYIAPYIGRFLPRAEATSNQGYTPYNGRRLAEFSGDTNNSFNMVRNTAAGGTPATDAATATAGGIAAGVTQPLSGEQLQAYTNPYTQNVLDVQKQRATQTFQEQQAGRDASAVQAGAFGGDRRFVQDSLANRDLNQQMQEMDATGLAAAFDSANNNYYKGQELGLNAAIAQGGLEQQGQNMKLGLAEALSGVGSKVQQRQQAGYDMAYQDFINQRDYPAQQLQTYSSLLSGVPVTQSSTTSTTAPAPDFLSQLAGLATSGAGLWDLFSN